MTGTRFRGDADVLVGRDRELDAMLVALQIARGGRPQVVVVEAAAGMGKTGLLRSFARQVRGPLVSATCDQFEQAIDFGAVELVLGAQAEQPVSSVAAGRSLLSWLSGMQPSPGDAAVVLLDDVQWMDPASIEAVRFSLRRLTADRVLVVLARRPPAGPDVWASLLADRDRTRHLPLGTLSAADVAELARIRRGWQLPPRSAERLARRTGGIPLLLGSYLDAANDEASASSADPPRVPTTAGAAVLTMIGPLGPDAALTVDALAVLGEPADRVRLGAVPGVADPGRAVADLLESRIAVLDPLRDRVDFTHALFRDAVYDRMDVERRRQLHRWAAGQTAGDRALLHRVAAAVRPDDELCAALRASADRARAAGQPALAASQRLQARRVAPSGTERELLLFDAMHDLLAADDVTGALGLEPEVLGTTPGPQRSFALGTLCHRSGRVEEARRFLHAAVDDAVAEGRIDVEARAGVELATMYAALNQGEQVLAAVQHARRVLPADADDIAGDIAVHTAGDTADDTDPAQLAAVRCLQAVGLWEVGRLAQATELLADYTPSSGYGSAATGVGPGISWEPDLFATRGMIRHWSGDLRGAVADLTYAIGLIGSWGPSLMRDRVHVQRSLTHFLLGDWDAATVDASTACALAHSVERPWMIPLAHAAAAYVPAVRGDFAAADEHLAIAREGQRKIPSAQGAALIAGAATFVAAERDDFATVLDILQPLARGPVLDRISAVRSYRWVFIGLVRAQIRLGELDRAAETLTTYAREVDRLPEGAASARLGWLRGLLAAERQQRAEAETHFLSDLADPTVPPQGHAECRLGYGRLLRSMGRRREAIEVLTRSRTTLARLRAVPQLNRVEAELSACGLSTAPTVDTLRLTDREQDVAALVAKGMTNNEIAAELFLTSKTVEYHLRNTFTKLGISRRQELRRLLSDPSSAAPR